MFVAGSKKRSQHSDANVGHGISIIIQHTMVLDVQIYQSDWLCERYAW